VELEADHSQSSAYIKNAWGYTSTSADVLLALKHRDSFSFIIKVKGKGVTLHAIEAHGGRGGIAPAHT
jgi:hypothetical protein